MTTETIYVINYPNLGNTSFTIPVNLVSQTDISPVCNNAYPQITCATTIIPNTGGIEEFVWESSPITLTGTPPAQGWIFAWGSCCRNPCANITDADTKNWVLRAVMYPNAGLNANPCRDNSPVFAEKPMTVISSGYAVSYNSSAIDIDYDSLSYSFATPLEGDPTASLPIAGYNTGYGWNSPLPDITYNPLNVPAQIDPKSGELTFTSYTNGAFLLVTKISAYRSGNLIAEVFREIEMVITPGDTNTVPNMNPPFFDPGTGSFTSYVDTVTAGDTVRFTLNINDFGLLPDGDAQTVFYSAWGKQFGTNYIDSTSGCAHPPCATLNPPPPSSALYGLTSEFKWVTDCSQLINSGGTADTLMENDFIFTVWDDYCPVPKIKSYFAKIFVKPKIPFLSGPELICTSVISNGDVTLNWIPPIDTAGIFDSYHIYSSGNPGGPFVRIDSIFNIAQQSYTHIGANANLYKKYYQVKTRSNSCSIKALENSNILSTLFLTCPYYAPNFVQLSWNPVCSPLLQSSSLLYEIKRQDFITWNSIGQVQNTYFVDTSTYTNTSANYMVFISDSSGCESISSDLNVSIFGINESSDASEFFHLSPNPFSTMTLLTSEISINSATLCIYDVLGKEVNCMKNLNGKEIIIQRGNMKPGMYFFRLEDRNSLKGHGKLLVQ